MTSTESHTPAPRVLVFGGTGTVGSHLVRDLLARGLTVRVLTRSAERATTLPAGVEGVVGDLLDPPSVRSALEDVDAVFLLNAVGATEVQEGLTAVNLAREAGVRRLVYLSVLHAERAVRVPHFGAKLPIEAAVKGSGIAYTILRPGSFYQNDLQLRDALLAGIYAQPIGNAGVSRVDVRDVAEAAAIALVDERHAGRTLNIVGPEVHTGGEVASIWAGALGRDVVYREVELAAWEDAMREHVPGWLAYGLRLMFAHIQTEGLAGTAEDRRLQGELLGGEARPFQAFVREAVERWKE